MDKRIEKIQLFIAMNFRNESVLENLANEVNLSQFHFQRIFKKEVGASPLHYINRIRLEHAVHFLAMYPDGKQIEIAFECGYSSPAVFARSFKQFYKVPLSKYKSELLKRKNTNKINTKSDNLPITYLSGKTIDVYPSNLLQENLHSLYSKLISKTKKPKTAYGIYIDAPVHKPLNECRYYAGFESNEETKISNTIEIEAGYYTYFEISGNFVQVTQQLIRFKEDVIDNTPYQIASLIGFENILLHPSSSDFDYFTSKRILFIKINR